MARKDSNHKRRYALVGTGSRAVMFIDPLTTRFRNVAEVVGLSDSNPTRLSYHSDRLAQELGYGRVPTFPAEQFEQMVRQTTPDVVIVTTIDSEHHKYIIQAMELGCDVITEKPMTIDADKCTAILDAVERTGRRMRVTFNYRWAPGATMMYKLLSEGTIGDIIHVDLEYLLDTSHGADFFRRWHREKDKSGGLIVHKATHHFDLVNWWIDSVPDSVFGMGRLAFYGRENAEKRGLKVSYERYAGNDTRGDPFAIDLEADERLRSLYLEAETHDGYFRDRNVFGDAITIEDTISVMVRYRTGVVLNYSLNAYMPREGFNVSVSGTKGRIEYCETHPSGMVAGQSDRNRRKGVWESELIVHPLFSDSYTVEIPSGEGGHGGADPLLQDQIFSPNGKRDAMGRDAGQGQGAASALIGIAANKSIKTGLPVLIDELCPALGEATCLSQLT